jgi:membrane-associated phospholipid phosphatase
MLNKFLRKLNLIDWLNYAYFSYLTVALIIRFNDVPYAGRLLLAHTVYIGLMTVLAVTVRKDSPWILRFIRLFYQVMCITFIYRETEFFMRLYHGHWLDPLIASVEMKVFGCHPNLMLEKIASPALTELMKFCYSSYFFLIPLVPLFLWFSKRSKGFYFYMFASTLALYLCYIGFTLFPVQGPRYYFASSVPPGDLMIFPWEPNTFGLFFKSTHLKGYIFTAFVDFVMLGGDAVGACIPSAHVGAVVVMLGVFRRYMKRGYPFILPLITGIILSTIYNRYHYVTDMVTGVIVGLIALAVADAVFRRKKDFDYIRE